MNFTQDEGIAAMQDPDASNITIDPSVAQLSEKGARVALTVLAAGLDVMRERCLTIGMGETEGLEDFIVRLHGSQETLRLTRVDLEEFGLREDESVVDFVKFLKAGQESLANIIENTELEQDVRMKVIQAVIGTRDDGYFDGAGVILQAEPVVQYILKGTKS